MRCKHTVIQIAHSKLALFVGDVIGIIFNRAEKTIAFTKNGMHLGVAFTNVCEERLYPTVGVGQSLLCA